MINWHGEPDQQVALKQSVYVEEQNQHHAYKDPGGINFGWM